MDISTRCRYVYNKYYVFLLYRLWEWIGETFSTYDYTYFQRYEEMKKVKQQLEDSFEKVRIKFGYESIDDMFEKNRQKMKEKSK